MTLTRFARMCESFENQTPTRKIEIVNESLSAFENKEDVIEILAMEYPLNNIGEKKAIKWLGGSFGVFESEILSQKKTWGDLAQGMFSFVSMRTPDSNMPLSDFKRYLSMDCSSMSGNAYVEIWNILPTLSRLELKWFLRYWLRTPRNGMGGGSNGVLRKALSKYYDSDEIEKLSKSNSMTNIAMHFEHGKPLSRSLVVGKGFKPVLAKKIGKKMPFENYMIDIKYDGNRYVIHKKNDTVMMFNRSAKLIDNSNFADVVEMVRTLDANELIIDTEVYPYDVHTDRPDKHQKMATRVHSKNSAEAMERVPVKLAIFDILSVDGVDLMNLSYRERLEHLDKLLPRNSIHRAEILDFDDYEAAYNYAIAGGYEGIMIKNLDTPYEMGKRSKNVLKHKPPRVNLDLVITSAKYGDGKRDGFFGTFGLSAPSIDGYTEVGSVGTGFSDADLSHLTTELKKIVDTHDNGVFYFLPRIVLEVDCDAITKDEKTGNVALRFPRMVRIRDDKAPSECDSHFDMVLSMG